MKESAINDLVNRWSEPDGIPFKGSLIGYDNCMCAQGQALHYIGGWSFERLRSASQDDADTETAKLLGISRTHSVLVRQINDSVDGAPSIVLTHPEQVIGDQAQTVLVFWHHIDGMTEDQWRAVQGDARGTWDATRAAWDAAMEATWDAARADGVRAARAAQDAVGRDARDAARALAYAAAGATYEIQGAAVMRAKGQPFFFLPLFGFADPEAVLAAETAE